MIATAKDLRFHTKEILEATMRGEEVVLTFHGKPSARIIPFQTKPRANRSKEDPLFGMWRDNLATDDVNGYVRKLRQGRVL